MVCSDSYDTKTHQRCAVASISGSASKSRRSTRFADGDVAKNFNNKLCDMKVNEFYDVGLDIAFHIVDKVNKVLLCVLRVACRATTFFVCKQGQERLSSRHAFDMISLRPMESDL